jgi:hypothetical protein
MSRAHTEEGECVSVKQWHYLDGLEIALICDSLFLLVVVQVIGLASQGIFKLKGAIHTNHHFFTVVSVKGTYIDDV